LMFPPHVLIPPLSPSLCLREGTQGATVLVGTPQASSERYLEAKESGE
jgi:hypothetical protein